MATPSRRVFFCSAYFFRDFSNFTEKPTAIVVRGFSDTGRAAWPRIGTPRRCDTRRNTPAELFIRAAVEEVEGGRWLYAGDGDSTLQVIDLDAPTAAAIKQTIATGGTTRVDEMAITGDGQLLLAANNAEDPPFATLFSANGNAPTSNTFKIIKITIDPAIVPSGAGLSIEQPAWDTKTQRFYTSIPIIANNPPGCTFAGPLLLQRRRAGDRPG